MRRLVEPEPVLAQVAGAAGVDLERVAELVAVFRDVIDEAVAGDFNAQLADFLCSGERATDADPGTTELF